MIFRRIILLLSINMRYVWNTMRYRSKRFPQQGATCIIFSRNRALQLEALIRSLEKFSKSPFKAIIQFSCSCNHRKSYDELIEQFKPYANYTFIEEQTFSLTLKEVIQSLRTQYMFFLVDDQVFVKPFDIENVLTMMNRNTFFSLRLGQSITDFGIFERKLKPHYFINGNFLEWSWKLNKDQKDWGYQFSVDGTIYRTIDVLCGTMSIPFKAPNSFEDNMNSVCLFRGDNKGISYRLPVVINLIINASRQEKEYDNFESGEYSTDDMLKLWHSGMRFSLEKISSIVFHSTHYIIKDINNIIS